MIRRTKEQKKKHSDNERVRREKLGDVYKEKIKKWYKRYYRKNRDRLISERRTYRLKNRKKINTQKRAWGLINKDSRYNTEIKRKYGINIDTYNDMLKKQLGVCAICKKPPGKIRLGVDHNHATGKIRGLLCASCNGWIGVFEEVNDVKVILKYLKMEK